MTITPVPPVTTDDLVKRIRAVEHGRLPEDVVAVAKQCILDCLGVALAGSRTPWLDILCQVMAPGGADSCTVLGRRERFGAVDAALVNGAAAHALDYDDTQPALQGHVSAPVLPAVLALAETRKLSGAALLGAFVAGVECECLLGSVLNPYHYAAGWHATATLGTFGAAAACAHLCGLRAAQTRHALVLAAVQAAGMRSVFGSAAKPFQVGKAAANGLLSALLAEAGLTTNAAVLEDGDRGFPVLYGGGLATTPPCDRAHSSDDHYFLRSVLFKFHVACHVTHPAIEALARLRERSDLRPDDVELVELHMADPRETGCGIEHPATGTEAKFSVRAVAAMTMLGLDTSDPATFDDARIQGEELQRAIDRVAVIPVAGASEWKTRARVLTTDGRTLEATVDLEAPPGDHAAQHARVHEKFDRLARDVLGEERADRVASMVDQLESVTDVAELAISCASE